MRKNLILTHEIYTKDLAKLYLKSFNIDISAEIGNVQKIYFYHCKCCDFHFFLPTVIGSDNFYEQLQLLSWYYLGEKYEYEYAKEFILKNTRVLEVGCGTGAFGGEIATKKYIGLEINSKAVKVAKEKGLDVRKEYIENFSKNNHNVFDIVCAFQVLEHIPNVSTFIQSCIDCLNIGGYFIISVPSADSFIPLVVNNILNLPPHHQTWWSDYCLKSISQLFDLDLIEINHEKLASIHKTWYLKVLVQQSFRKFFVSKQPLVDLSIKWKLVTKISSLISIFLSKGFEDQRLSPFGHSVIAIYTKK